MFMTVGALRWSSIVGHPGRQLYVSELKNPD